MKTFGTIFLALTFIGVSSAQHYFLLEEIASSLYQTLDQYADSFQTSFDMYVTNLRTYSSNLGEIAAYTTDRKAGDHVIRARSNYTATALAVTEIMNSTRDNILISIRSGKDVIAAKIPEVEAVANDLESILRSRKCSAQRINSFFTSLFGNISSNVQATMSQVGYSYMNLVYRQYIPSYLVEDFFMKLSNCLSNADGNGLTCLLRAEDFYLSPSVNLVKDSANLMSNYIVNSNYRLTQALVSEVDHEMLHGYQGVYKYSCVN